MLLTSIVDLADTMRIRVEAKQMGYTTISLKNNVLSYTYFFTQDVLLKILETKQIDRLDVELCCHEDAEALRIVATQNAVELPTYPWVEKAEWTMSAYLDIEDDDYTLSKIQNFISDFFKKNLKFVVNSEEESPF